MVQLNKIKRQDVLKLTTDNLCWKRQVIELHLYKIYQGLHWHFLLHLFYTETSIYEKIESSRELSDIKCSLESNLF